MSVSTTNALNGPFVANGATTAFPFTFTVLEAADVAVFLDGVQVTSGYSVTFTSGAAGGSVVFTTAPASGTIWLALDPAFTQTTEFSDGSAWLAAPVNNANDRAALRDQALARDVGRAMLVPLGETAGALPSADSRVGMFLSFDADGNPVMSSGTGADAGLRADLTSGAATAYITMANGISLARSVPLTINVRGFGAVGDGVTDDTAAIQTAINFVKARCWNNATLLAAELFFPAGNYLVTQSLNCTSGSDSAPLGWRIRGAGKYATVFTTKLTEAYAVLDFSGNTGSGVSDISIRQESGCKATAGILRQYVSADTVGFYADDRDLLILMLSCPGIVSTIDLYRLSRVWTQGTYGAAIGGGSGLGLASKFRTVIANSDITMVHLDDCQFLGGLPLYLTGAVTTYAAACYAAIASGFANPIAINGGIAAAIVIDSSESPVGGSSYYFYACRTENQDSSGSRPAMYAVALVKNGTGSTSNGVNTLSLTGDFEVTVNSAPSASSAIVYSDANSTIRHLHIDGSNAWYTYPVLALNGSCSNTSYDIRWLGTNPIGTVSGTTHAGVVLGDSFTAADFATLGGASTGRVHTSNNAGALKSTSDYAFLPYATSVVAAEVAALKLTGTAVAYAGGSAYADVLQITVPANVMMMTTARPGRSLVLEAFLSATVAAFSLQIAISGTSTAGAALTLTAGAITNTTGTPAGVARIVLQNPATATGQLAAHGTITLGSAVIAFAFANAGSLDWTKDFVVSVQANAASASPVTVSTAILAQLT